MFNLNVRSCKKSGNAPLLTRMRIGESNHWVNLYLMVDITKWNEVKGSERKMSNYLDKLGYNMRLVEIEFGIKELKRRGNFTKESVERMIQDIVLKEKREKLLEKERVGKEIRDRSLKSIKTYITLFVKQIETGEVRTKKGELYQSQTIKTWRQLKRILLDFYEKHPFTWEVIDQKLINRFISHLEQCCYMKKTRDKYLRLFKQVISDSEKLGYHSNTVAKHLITRLNVKESDKAKEIYLTKEELDGLYNMELEGYQEIVRDLFLIGCYTGQRFSDFSTLNEGCIGTTSKGVKVIRIEQVKTGNMVVVPIMDSRLEILLKKYNYNVPSITGQFFNREIKEIGRMLSATVPSLSKRERTLLKKQERLSEERGSVTFERDTQGWVVKPRYQLISSHTCRRSCITNMYLSKKYTIPQMMSVSGHKDERTFREYVKLDKDEIAETVVMSSADGMF